MVDQTQPTTTKPLSTEAPKPKVYEVSREDIEKIFEAARRGDVYAVIGLIQQFGLGWYTFDIDRLKTESDWYAPLESSGDSLMNLLQSHKGGKFNLNPGMQRYLEEARLQMNAAGKSTSSDVSHTISKLLNGEEISEEEAKDLFKWCSTAKELVIPPGKRAEIASNLLKTVQQKYEQELLNGGRLADAFSYR